MRLRLVATNLLAGLTVAFVALPLALAFGIGSGLGAQAGLVTAVIAGMIAALAGGSRHQVSGPTGAMTVILIPIVALYGPVAILQVGLMAGGFLVLAGLAKLGNHIHRLPTALVEGFTAGIALVIAMQQVAFVLGVKLQANEHIWQSVFEEVQIWLGEPQVGTLILGLAAISINLLGSKRFPRLPVALISIIGLSFIANLFGLQTQRIGDVPTNLLSIDLNFLDSGNWLPLVPPALAIAFLAGLESLLSARIADRLVGFGNHNPDRELIGQGLANIAVPFFGGVPATAALARTAVNIRAGASSRLAGFSHAVFLLLLVLFLAPNMAQIPLAALGGVLIATAYHMVKIDELILTAKQSRLDAIVLLITLIATVVLDLISALAIGLLIYLALRKTKLSYRQPPIDPEETLGD